MGGKEKKQEYGWQDGCGMVSHTVVFCELGFLEAMSTR